MGCAVNSHAILLSASLLPATLLARLITLNSIGSHQRGDVACGAVIAWQAAAPPQSAPLPFALSNIEVIANPSLWFSGPRSMFYETYQWLHWGLGR